MAYPDGWTILNEELWHLTPTDSQAFWQALCRARWVRPVTFRQQLGLVGHVRLTEDGLGRLCQPAVVLAVLEALAQEGRLRRTQCTRIEDTILCHVQATGRWRGDPEPSQACATWHAPDVIVFAEVGTPTWKESL